MGRGNVCTFGKCEGLYFVDRDFLDVYTKNIGEDEEESKLMRDVECGDTEFEYNEAESEFNREDFFYLFAEEFRRRFPSFEFVDKWISNSRRAMLENRLFYIVLEDNQWSIAVELIQKEGEYGGEELVGLQMGLYVKYLKGIEQILLDMNGEVGIYTGAWTHGIIKKG